MTDRGRVLMPVGYVSGCGVSVSAGNIAVSIAHRRQSVMRELQEGLVDELVGYGSAGAGN